LLRIWCALLLALLAVPSTASASDRGYSVGTPLASGGAAVASSRDGSVIVVGDSTVGFAGGIGYGVGTIQVLARRGSTWHATDPIYQQENQSHSDSHFGSSVAISPDGTVVVAGSPGGQDQSGQKARAEVFSIAIGGDGTPHATRVAVLASTGAGHLGTSVAVTRAGGHTIVAAGEPDGSPFLDGAFRFGAGQVDVFTDPVSEVFSGGLGDVYGTELADETAAGSSGSALGTSVAITADASRIVAGAPHRGPGFHAGAVDAFTRSGSNYTGAQVLAGSVPGGNLGTSVAVSGDGRTAIAGEPMLDVAGAAGAARTIALGAAASPCASGRQPALPATLTPGDGGHPGDAFGTSVALSADGLTALVGAPYARYSPGTPFGDAAVPGSVYAEDAAPGGAAPAEQVLVPAQNAAQGEPGSHYGQTVALSGDSLAALAGAPGDRRGHGGTFSFGWAFPIARPARPGLCEPPPAAVTPTPTPTPAPSTTPPPSSPAAQLAVACSGRRLTLLNVAQRKGRVALLGAADAALIGHHVRILYDNRSAVAAATVRADGFFSASAKLPPKRVRGTNHARYVAVSGADRSLFLKLTRRVTLDAPVARRGTVTLTGRVLPPLARPRAPIAVRQQVSCGTSTIVARAKTRADGRFRIRVPAPAGAKAAIYRLATQVRKAPGNPKRFPTFSLPQVVGL
jgi:hypothetical protein